MPPPIALHTPNVAKTTTLAPTGAATPTIATTATTNVTTNVTTPAPSASVSTSVGGRAIAGDVEAVRVPGRDVDVLLPKGATMKAYVDALARSGAFPARATHIDTLCALVANAPATSSAGATTIVDRRPRVGIILSDPKMLIPGEHANTENIIKLVEGMGCKPVLIPPCADFVATGGPDGRARAIAAMARTLDGLVGPGGADVDPSIYGEANTASVKTNVVRDRFEADFVRVALDCDLFGFGICRSHQLWNAAAGGRLIQNVEGHRDGTHGFKAKKRSMIFEATRKEAMRVNSLHHQVVDWTGWGFRVVGREDSGMIEATERWNAITTQFHPELMQDDPAQRALFSTVGRRAHAFALLKDLRADGHGDLPTLLARMRNDPRYDESDIAWANRDLRRHFR